MCARSLSSICRSTDLLEYRLGIVERQIVVAERHVTLRRDILTAFDVNRLGLSETAKITATYDEHEGGAMTANPRLSTITLAVYGAYVAQTPCHLWMHDGSRGHAEAADRHHRSVLRRVLPILYRSRMENEAGGDQGAARYNGSVH